MISVAILDSGVTMNHPHIGNIAGGITIAPHGTSDEYPDWIGHGTAVAAAIHEKAPEARLFIVKIFGRRLSANIDQLAMGIEWALDHQCRFLNLSLGTMNPGHAARLLPCIERARRLGSQIISAATSLPGSLADVIGVDVDPSLGRDEMRLVDGVTLASPYPRPIPGVPQEHNLQGISFAVANVTGLIAQHASQALE